MKRSIKKYGWIPDIPDHRDFAFKSSAVKLPSKVDLRSICPVVYNQGSLGSCTGNAIAGAIHVNELLAQSTAPYTPSRLFIYYNERVIEGTVNSDSGAMIRDGIKSVVKQGACDEKLWPYVISKFTAKPTKAAYNDAMKKLVSKYERVSQTLGGIRSALADGFPVIFGFSVYSSFESSMVARTGDVPYPKSKEQLLGGHAVIAVGYDDVSQKFLCRNSWGSSWGMKGYFTMPYAYLINARLASDFWVIK